MHSPRVFVGLEAHSEAGCVVGVLVNAFKDEMEFERCHQELIFTYEDVFSWLMTCSILCACNLLSRL